MTWLTALLTVAFVAAVAAVTGLVPSGARPVARTGLMNAARVALVAVIAIAVYIALRR